MYFEFSYQSCPGADLMLVSAILYPEQNGTFDDPGEPEEMEITDVTYKDTSIKDALDLELIEEYFWDNYDSIMDDHEYSEI